ncbi:MAG: hypothetical protein DRH50_11575 [Deltaproteobacteria bacterium]|nr:MAG: hypothetical protein DRH50_11575 [Deltaproteobacteria bacterium]
MVIDKVSRYIHSTQVARDGRQGKDGSFAQVLNRTMDTGTPPASSSDACAPTRELGSSTLQKASGDRTEVLCRAFRVLDLLEGYANALKDPRMTLKSIEPLINRVQYGIKDLDAALTHCTGQRDELSRLVNQISITAGVEAFKFRRGDYLA